MVPYIFSPSLLSTDLKSLISWLLERQEPPLHLFRTADRRWWNELRRQRLFPLLYLRLERVGLTGTLPLAVAELLKHDYFVALQQSLYQEGEVRRLLGNFRTAGIEVILLKGAALRLQQYEDPATRPISDLDLLISPESLQSGIDFLEGCGYTREPEKVTPRFGFRERFRVSLHFMAPPSNILMVDLHWGVEGVANYYRLPFNRLGAQTQNLDWQGLPVRILSPEPLLLHFCLHHYDEGHDLLGLLDLGLSLTRVPLNWSILLAEAAQCHCQAPVLLMLRGLEGLLPGTVPPQVLRELAACPPRTVERLILRHSHNRLVRWLTPLAHQPHPSAWAAYLMAFLWPEPAYLASMCGCSSRLAYWASSLKYLFSRQV